MKTDPVYLDNAATTAVLPEVIEEMNRYFSRDYGNPSSSHVMGVEAARVVESASNTIISSLVGGGWDVVFTGSGTEANNLAIVGCVKKHKGGGIVTAALEHLSVLEPCRVLSQKGYRLVQVLPGSDGTVSAPELLDKVDGSTILVTLQHANNEIGTIQPLEEIGAGIKRLFPNVILHMDAVQSAGKIDIAGSAKWADLVSLSAHKIHGPKGIGALLVKQGIKKPSPLIRGGGQQGGVRSGTENVPGIAGFALAVRLASKKIEQSKNHLKMLEDEFDAAFHETGRARRMYARSPHIPGFVVVGFERIPPEVVEHSMEEYNIIVSSTAACSSRKVKRSHVLAAVGCPEDTHIIRIVPSRTTGRGTMKKAAESLNRILEK